MGVAVVIVSGGFGFWFGALIVVFISYFWLCVCGAIWV